MPVDEKLEEKIHRTDKKMKELSNRMQQVNQIHQALLKQLGTSSQEIKTFAEDPENFPPDIWKELQEETRQRDEQLNLELNNVADSNKTKQTIDERGKVQQHWMFVR